MLNERVEQYCESTTLRIEHQLGFGIHGEAYALSHLLTFVPSVVKVFEDESPFERELAVYLRLREVKTSIINGFAVPQLFDFGSDLLIIQMSLVSRPFCLDFGALTSTNCRPTSRPSMRTGIGRKKISLEVNTGPKCSPSFANLRVSASTRPMFPQVTLRFSLLRAKKRNVRFCFHSRFNEQDASGYSLHHRK